jgi:hypothetical protein
LKENKNAENEELQSEKKHPYKSTDGLTKLFLRLRRDDKVPDVRFNEVKYGAVTFDNKDNVDVDDAKEFKVITAGKKEE